MEKIIVSVVVPVYAGGETLRRLVTELADVRGAWSLDSPWLHLTEVVFVDDDSVDNSADVLHELAAEHDWLRVLTLSANFGQHPATVAGILQTSGDWVVTMDEDLQHRPKYIRPMLEYAVRNRLDIAYAKPAGAVHQSSWYRDLCSRMLKRFVSWLSGNRHVRDFNSFRVIRGSIARAAGAVSAHETYFDVALGWFTRRVGTFAVEMCDRRSQERVSGYSLRRLLSHARRMMISSQTRWLRSGAVIGMAAVLLSFLMGVYKLTQRLVDPTFLDVPGWTSLFLAILFFGGLTSFLMGIVLEYLWTMLQQAHGKPTYFVVDRSSDSIVLQEVSRRECTETTHQRTHETDVVVPNGVPGF